MTEKELRALENPGMPPEEWQAWIEAEVALHGALDRLQCVKCGGLLARTYDQRQDGPSSLGPGYVWFKYACTVCSWFGDRKERE